MDEGFAFFGYEDELLRCQYTYRTPVVVVTLWSLSSHPRCRAPHGVELRMASLLQPLDSDGRPSVAVQATATPPMPSPNRLWNKRQRLATWLREPSKVKQELDVHELAVARAKEEDLKVWMGGSSSDRLRDDSNDARYRGSVRPTEQLKCTKRVSDWVTRHDVPI